MRPRGSRDVSSLHDLALRSQGHAGPPSISKKSEFEKAWRGSPSDWPATSADARQHGALAAARLSHRRIRGDWNAWPRVFFRCRRFRRRVSMFSACGKTPIRTAQPQVLSVYSPNALGMDLHFLHPWCPFCPGSGVPRIRSRKEGSGIYTSRWYESWLVFEDNL